MSESKALRRAIRPDRQNRTHRLILIFGEQHLRTVLAQFSIHYNGRRPHRALPTLIIPLRILTIGGSGADKCWEG